MSSTTREFQIRVHDEAAIAMLGHELQHAAEIAGARWMVDQDTLAQLYMRIGYASRWHGVDTIQAHETAREVLKELRASGERRLSSTD